MPDTMSSFSMIYVFLKNLNTGKRSVQWKIQISNIHVLRVKRGWLTCALSWWWFPERRRLPALPGLGSSEILQKVKSKVNSHSVLADSKEIMSLLFMVHDLTPDVCIS